MIIYRKEKLKLLLVTRKWKTITLNTNPIGVYDLAAYARNLNYLVDVYYIDELPVTNHYDLIGLSVFEGKNQTIFKDVQILKQVYGNTKIIVGGRWTKTVDNEAVEWFIKNNVELWSGEGEIYFSKSRQIDFTNYPGWYKKDLITTNSKGRNIMSSRGCPFHCYFCHNPENKINYFNSDYTVNNIQLLLEQGANEIFFADDIFTLKKEHMLNIYNDLKRKYLNIDDRNLFFTHVNLINEEIAEVMKKFKPTEVQVGLESGDNSMLKIMGKNFTTSKAFERIKLLSNYVKVNGLFLIGFPGETTESLQNTFQFVKELKPFLSKKWVSLYQPIKNTNGYFRALKEGTLRKELKNNATVAYIPEGLSEEDLLRYRDLILNY